MTHNTLFWEPSTLGLSPATSRPAKTNAIASPPVPIAHATGHGPTMCVQPPSAGPRRRPSATSLVQMAESTAGVPPYVPEWLRSLHRVTTTPAALHVPELADEPGLVHGFSTVAVGSVGLKRAPDSAAALAARRTFADVLGLEGAELTTIGSVHGSSVARVDKPSDSVDNVDALLTDRPGVVLFATYADCYPIVLWDPQLKVAGLVHAGWRGTRAGVAA